MGHLHFHCHQWEFLAAQWLWWCPQLWTIDSKLIQSQISSVITCIDYPLHFLQDGQLHFSLVVFWFLLSCSDTFWGYIPQCTMLGNLHGGDLWWLYWHWDPVAGGDQCNCCMGTMTLSTLHVLPLALSRHLPPYALWNITRVCWSAGRFLSFLIFWT